MEYEDLRKYQRMERNATTLAEIPETFYADLKHLIHSYKQAYDSTHAPNDLKTLENIVKISRDIFERREQKIIMRSLRSLKTEDLRDSNITAHEKKLYEDVLAVIKSSRVNFEEMLTGEGTIHTAPVKQEIKITEQPAEPERKESEGLNTVLVRILKRVPKFVTTDLQEQGPFEPNEIKRLPEKEAQLLTKKSFAELI